MTTSAQTIRHYQGPALFERGFRPLFLGAGIFAGLALPLWLVQFSLGWQTPSFLSARDFHVHEMIFGYFAAVVSGFLLTAVPNWTGRLPVAGRPLVLLSGLWLAGRLAMFFSSLWPLAAAFIDVLFLLAMACILCREVIAGRHYRSIPICALIALLASANIAFNGLALSGNDTQWAERPALALVVLFISLIGGRVVPSFTRNWMVRQQLSPLPTAFSRYDKILLALNLAALALWIAYPAALVSGISLAILSLGHLIRLARWRGVATFSEPLLAILHIGYLWLPLWFALTALAIIAPQFAAPSAATHALTAGAIGTMTIGFMTRIILGHSGRPLTAGPATTLIYGLVIVGALLRIAAPYLPFDYVSVIVASGCLWSVGFWLFVAIYGPICLAPRAA